MGKRRASDATVSMEDFARIKAALIERGVKPECPACEGAGLHIVGYAVHPIQEEPTVGGDVVRTNFPTVVLVCPVCGYTRAHSLVTLGLDT